MIYVIIGLSIFFIAIGFTVTESNAKYLLSGYNTMNEAEREKFDITSYIPFFRNFHIFLGLSFLILGIFILYFLGENAGGIFLSVYPILAYIYFMATSSKYTKGLDNKKNKLGILLMICTLLLVVGFLGYGFMENKITYDRKQISISGSYSETLPKSEIKSVELVNQLPDITVKKNGFALGTIRKGYFKTGSGETIKLILNSDTKPVILFTKVNGEKIYYSAKSKSNTEVMADMRRTIPTILYK